MALLQCERCGADLPPTVPGTTVPCAYCGAAQRVTGSAARTVVPVADVARTESLVGHLLELVRRENGVDLSRDATAMTRLREAAARAVAALDRGDAAEVELPFLGATLAGPFHLSRYVTPMEVERGFEPTVADVEERRAVAHGEELGTQEARLEALRLRLGVPPDVRPASRSSLFGCAVLVALLAAGGGVAFYFARGDAGDPPAVVVTDVDRGEGWAHLRPDGLRSPFPRFDSAVGAAWALGVARQWAPDARLDSIYLTGVRADGTIDLRPHGDETTVAEPAADYRFVSDVRRRQAARRIEVARNDVRSSFRVLVQNGLVTAMSSTEGADDVAEAEKSPPPAFEPAACPLARVLAVMRDGGLARRPAWDVVTTWDGSRWTWWLNMTDVPGGAPRVDAATCAVVR